MNGFAGPERLVRDGHFELATLALAVRYQRAIVAELAPFLRGCVLEVGAGTGHIARHIQDLPAVKELFCVEPAPDLAAQLKQRVPHASVIEGTVETARGLCAPDAIVSCNVLEHIRDDELELAAYAQMLRAQAGHLCLFVPAAPELYAPIDRDFGHYRRYSHTLLRQRFQRARLELVQLRYFNAVGYVGWWVRFCLRKKRSFDPNMVKLFDRVVFPVTYAAERRFGPPPRGLSLIAVGRPL